MIEKTSNLQASRTWLIASGIFFLLVGIAAMSSPVLFTAVIVKLVAFLILASGVVSLVMAIMGKHKGYLILEIISGIIRIAAGILLLNCLASSAVFITMVFAWYLLAEGVFVMAASLKLKPLPGWFWTLLSGLASGILGVMILLKWPLSSLVVLGLYFGISQVFKAAAQFALALTPRRPAGQTH
jgi:uncharacterized membrane protein HdeD (DUF308 family)